MKKRYLTYDEIPSHISTFVCRVANIKSITELTVTEINNFLVDLEDYYHAQQQKLEDFTGDL